jgi:hypothetical protein
MILNHSFGFCFIGPSNGTETETEIIGKGRTFMKVPDHIAFFRANLKQQPVYIAVFCTMWDPSHSHGKNR